jgi:hypothetical protein
MAMYKMYGPQNNELRGPNGFVTTVLLHWFQHVSTCAQTSQTVSKFLDREHQNNFEANNKFYLESRWI